MTDWPREVGGHLIDRDHSVRAGSHRFHCVECGRTYEEIDPEELEAAPCVPRHVTGDQPKALG